MADQLFTEILVSDFRARGADEGSSRADKCLPEIAADLRKLASKLEPDLRSAQRPVLRAGVEAVTRVLEATSRFIECRSWVVPEAPRRPVVHQTGGYQVATAVLGRIFLAVIIFVLVVAIRSIPALVVAICAFIIWVLGRSLTLLDPAGERRRAALEDLASVLLPGWARFLSRAASGARRIARKLGNRIAAGVSSTAPHEIHAEAVVNRSAILAALAAASSQIDLEMRNVDQGVVRKGDIGSNEIPLPVLSFLQQELGDPDALPSEESTAVLRRTRGLATDLGIDVGEWREDQISERWIVRNSDMVKESRPSLLPLVTLDGGRCLLRGVVYMPRKGKGDDARG